MKRNKFSSILPFSKKTIATIIMQEIAINKFNKKRHFSSLENFFFKKELDLPASTLLESIFDYNLATNWLFTLDCILWSSSLFPNCYIHKKLSKLLSQLNLSMFREKLATLFPICLIVSCPATNVVMVIIEAI